MFSDQSLCERVTKSLDCQIALSSFIDQDSAKCQLALEPVDVTAEEKKCWNGRRITVFGQTCSGVSSLCSMFCNVSANMSDSKKNSKPFGPLMLKLFFDHVHNEDEPLVCTELEGIGHYRKEKPMKRLNELLSMFPTWRFLSKTTQEHEAVDPCDLVDLRNNMVAVLQDIDDAFAIRLGFVLSDTVVIVHHGNNLLKIQQQVNEYLDHYCAVPTRETDVANKYCGIVRQTTNIFVVVNFVEGSFEVNSKFFHKWTEDKGLHCDTRQPRGKKVAIQLYSEVSGTRARATQCKVTFVPLFRDSDGREHNSAVVAHIKQNTAMPKHRAAELESPFDPVELAASLLLPSFCEGLPPTLRIAKYDSAYSEDYTVYRVFTMGTIELKKNAMFTRYQGPDDNHIGILQRLTEKDGEMDSSEQEIYFTITISNAFNIRVSNVDRLSSGNESFFHIRAICGDPGCRKLYSRLVILRGLCTYVKDRLAKRSDRVVFVFHKGYADTRIDSD